MVAYTLGGTRVLSANQAEHGLSLDALQALLHNTPHC